MSELLTAKQVADQLGISRTTVYELAAGGRLACYRLGARRGRLKFKASDLEAYLEASRVGPKVKTEQPPKRQAYVSKYDHGF
jgi:excisionase family DNA binding protein